VFGDCILNPRRYIMATTKKSAPTLELSPFHRVGARVASLPEQQPDVVQGFMAARREPLVEARKARNAAVVDGIYETLMAELS
jgi:hypothetical protein